MTEYYTELKEPIDIIIPTYDNIDQLLQCVCSVLRTQGEYPLRVVVVNNGSFPLEDVLPKVVEIINPAGNKGWTGGLKLGVSLQVSSSSPYVVFLNDDTYVPLCSVSWLRDMVRVLETTPLCGVIGPSSNCVSGYQNIWSPPFIIGKTEVPFLIGFCKVVRRKALEEIGGIDERWVHGDDLDLSLRMRKGGYGLLCLKSTFVYHHGFQTGERMFGGREKKGGWNSQEQVENTNISIIKEHGFLNWWEMYTGEWEPILSASNEDIEGNMVRNLCKSISPSMVLDIGYGDTLTVKGSIGIDKKKDGIDLNRGLGKFGGATGGHDHKYDRIIARHILEHLDKPDERIIEWLQRLTTEGKLIICCPNEDINDTIPMDKTHKHAFSPSYLRFIVEGCGGHVTFMRENVQGISFLMVVE